MLLPITTDVFALWLALLKRIEPRGPHIFDFQIAATMLAHGIARLVTYNGADFRMVVELEIVNPE